jgi:hypothetical protein
VIDLADKPTVLRHPQSDGVLAHRRYRPAGEPPPQDSGGTAITAAVPELAAQISRSLWVRVLGPPPLQFLVGAVRAMLASVVWKDESKTQPVVLVEVDAVVVLEAADDYAWMDGCSLRELEDLCPAPSRCELRLEGTRNEGPGGEVVRIVLYAFVGHGPIWRVNEGETLSVMEQQMTGFVEKREPEDVCPSVAKAKRD